MLNAAPRPETPGAVIAQPAYDGLRHYVLPGTRGAVHAGQLRRVGQDNLDRLRNAGVAAVETNVIYAVAPKA